MRTRYRRPLAILLALLGAILIFLATDTWLGIVLLLLGIGIEAIGIALGR